MMNPISKFSLAKLPGVQIYLDSEDKARFYVVPTKPRVALDEQSGKPQISLLLYKHGNQISGGMFTLTADLQITAAERVEIQTELAEQMTAEAPPRAAPNQMPPPNVVSPDWLEGNVTLVLTKDLSIRGTPSMLGDNRCTFSLNLDANQAKLMQEAWKKNLPDALIEYDTQVRAAGQNTGTRIDEMLKNANVTSKMSINISGVNAARYHLNLSGPLTVSNLSDHLQIVSF